jgi:hypothetical protein
LLTRPSGAKRTSGPRRWLSTWQRRLRPRDGAVERP